MQYTHQPASRAFKTMVGRILQRPESVLQRRNDCDKQAPGDPETEDMLAGLEFEDSDWEAWVEAGGDLLMGSPPKE